VVTVVSSQLSDRGCDTVTKYSLLPALAQAVGTVAHTSQPGRQRVVHAGMSSDSVSREDLRGLVLGALRTVSAVCAGLCACNPRFCRAHA
jgi:hypothetical protein